ncbi:MAG: GNAT family N-acetyltransferase [Dehalococcoidia bacterium]
MRTSPALEIVRLDGTSARAAVPGLAAILRDCVEGGASVSFLSPLSVARSEAFWEQVASSVGRNETALLVARDEQGIQGTVQLLLSLPENQPHRAEVAKLLVHRRARRRGIAAALMAGVEREAHAEQRSLLTLDTASDDARRLYDRMGWSLCGRIPGYALNPDRSVCDTWIYWKRME